MCPKFSHFAKKFFIFIFFIFDKNCDGSFFYTFWILQIIHQFEIFISMSINLQINVTQNLLHKQNRKKKKKEYLLSKKNAKDIHVRSA